MTPWPLQWGQDFNFCEMQHTGNIFFLCRCPHSWKVSAEQQKKENKPQKQQTKAKLLQLQVFLQDRCCSFQEQSRSFIIKKTTKKKQPKTNVQVCSSEDDSKDQYRPQFQLKHSIRTVSWKNNSHCKSHLPLMSALTYTCIHTCHTHPPLLPQYNLQQQRLSRCSQSPPGPLRCIWAIRPLSSHPAARWYLVTSTDSPQTNEHFGSIQSSKHWCSKKCSQLCLLKDTEMLMLSSILQRC